MSLGSIAPGGGRPDARRIFTLSTNAGPDGALALTCRALSTLRHGRACPGHPRHTGESRGTRDKPGGVRSLSPHCHAHEGGHPVTAGRRYWAQGHRLRVIPAQAGIQGHTRRACRSWIPAFAGMTAGEAAIHPSPSGEGGLSRGTRDKPGGVREVLMRYRFAACNSPHPPRRPTSRSAKIGARLPSPRGEGFIPALSPPCKTRVDCHHLVQLRGAL